MISIGAGCISDIAEPRERGKFYAVFQLGALVGPAFGPLLGTLRGSLQNARAELMWNRWDIRADSRVEGDLLVLDYLMRCRPRSHHLVCPPSFTNLRRRF